MGEEREGGRGLKEREREGERNFDLPFFFSKHLKNLGFYFIFNHYKVLIILAVTPHAFQLQKKDRPMPPHLGPQ